MTSEQPVPARPTVLRNSTVHVVLIYALFAVIGAGLGWVVRLLSEWASKLDGLPLHDWISVIAKIDDPAGTVLCVIAGAGAGAFVVYLTLKGSVAVSVSKDRVIWKAGKKIRRIERDEISAIYLDGIDDLVFLGTDTEELARANCNLDSDEVKQTFLAYGYPFFDEDPHLDEFVRWVEDTPELTPSANALLKAREKALKENEDESAAELRVDLGKLGVIVRQNDDRQFYRTIGDEALADPPEDEDEPDEDAADEDDADSDAAEEDDADSDEDAEPAVARS